MTSVFWFFLTVIGPLMLLGALGWAFWCERNANGDGTHERSEGGVRQLRRGIANDPRYRED